jgi:hypothetical protein
VGRWEHINLTGDYVWRQNRRVEGGKFRPLRLVLVAKRTIFPFREPRRNSSGWPNRRAGIAPRTRTASSSVEWPAAFAANARFSRSCLVCSFALGEGGGRSGEGTYRFLYSADIGVESHRLLYAALVTAHSHLLDSRSL